MWLEQNGPTDNIQTKQPEQEKEAGGQRGWVGVHSSSHGTQAQAERGRGMCRGRGGAVISGPPRVGSELLLAGGVIKLASTDRWALKGPLGP